MSAADELATIHSVVNSDLNPRGGRAAEVILTFDNLGEAADEELGNAVETMPHFSVVQALPRILSLLARAGLHATFFVEAINVDRYPDALARILEHGHELGCHAWRHESWHRLEREARHDVLSRSLAALRSCGAEVQGFRPPGGLLDKDDLAALREQGVRWVSPAGRRAGVLEDVASLPFTWGDIDAYFLAPELGSLREGDGHSGEPFSLEQFAEAVQTRIDAFLDFGDDTPLCLIFHPFLYTTEEHFATLARLLERLHRAQASGDAHVGPGRAVAERLRRRRDPATPDFDRSTWA
jgi:peptidoglycan-N-acetylglucosamine deacetylase